MIKTILMLPFHVLNAVAICLCIAMELFIKPFVYGSTFIYNLMKEVVK